MRRVWAVRHAAAASVVVIFTASASAQSINIDIDGAAGSGAGAPASSWGAAAGQSGPWNSVIFLPTNPGPFSLFDTSGVATAVTIRQTSATGTLNFTQNATTGNVKLLMDDAVFAATPYTLTISGLAPGPYTIFTYANAPSGSGGFERNGLVIAGSTSPNPQSVGGPIIASAPLTTGLTHAQHIVTVAAGQNLVINANPFNGGNAYINGIQIVRAITPLAEITSPSESSCVCGTTAIFGTAANLTSFTLDYATTDAGPWTTIASQSNGVVGGVIGVWNTSTLASGDYTLRLRVNGPLSQQAIVTRRVFVDRSAPQVTVNTPTPAEVVGGTVQITGITNDRCLSSIQLGYSTSTAGPFISIGTATPTADVIPGTMLAHWDTQAQAIADASYYLRLAAIDSCGVTGSELRAVTVDNTRPLVSLQSPTASTAICGEFEVIGTINDAHLASWALYYSSDTQAGWTTIASGTQNVSGRIAIWNTNDIPNGPYTLRLVARDRATVDAVTGSGNLFEVTRSVFVGAQGDLNQDGMVNGADLGILLSQFGLRCN